MDCYCTFPGIYFVFYTARYQHDRPGTLPWTESIFIYLSDDFSSVCVTFTCTWTDIAMRNTVTEHEYGGYYTTRGVKCLIYCFVKSQYIEFMNTLSWKDSLCTSCMECNGKTYFSSSKSKIQIAISPRICPQRRLGHSRSVGHKSSRGHIVKKVTWFTLFRCPTVLSWGKHVMSYVSLTLGILLLFSNVGEKLRILLSIIPPWKVVL